MRGPHRVPAPGEAVPELKQALDRLRGEHVAIAGLIGELRGATEPATLDRISDELEAHFACEEEHLVPVLNSLISVPWDTGRD